MNHFGFESLSFRNTSLHRNRVRIPSLKIKFQKKLKIQKQIDKIPRYLLLLYPVLKILPRNLAKEEHPSLPINALFVRGAS